MTMLISIIGRACFRKVTKRKGTPARSAMPATVRLALAPISVPLSPRQAPSESVHHSSRSNEVAELLDAESGLLDDRSQRTGLQIPASVTEDRYRTARIASMFGHVWA